MRSADLSEGFSGLKQWSEPVIYDRLTGAYSKLITDRELASEISVDKTFLSSYSALTIANHFPGRLARPNRLIRAAKQVAEEFMSCVRPTYPKASPASSNGLSR